MLETSSRYFWETYYKTQHGDNPLTYEPSSFAIFISSYVMPSMRILELGCGNGRDAAIFTSRGLDYVGVDQAAQAITRCKSSIPSSTFVEASFTEPGLVLKTGVAFDAVYARFTFHSIAVEEEVVALNNSFAALKESGYLLVETRSINDPRYGKGTQIGEHEYYDTHYRRFADIHQLMMRVRMAGFCIRCAHEEYVAAHYGDDKAVVVRLIAQKPVLDQIRNT